MTKPDDLADLLRRIEDMDDELDELDDRLEALAAGTLTDPARTGLFEAASRDPLLDTAVHVMQPLDTDFRSRLVSTARREYGDKPEEDRVVSLDQRRRSRAIQVARVAAPVLLAALALFWVAPRGPSSSPPAEPSPLPNYVVDWRSGEQESRQAEVQERPRFTAGSAIEVWLRPETATEHDVQTVVFVDSWDRPLEIEPQISSTGAVRLSGVLGEPPWAFDAGPHELLVAVGPAGDPVPTTEPEAPWHVTLLPFDVY